MLGFASTFSSVAIAAPALAATSQPFAEVDRYRLPETDYFAGIRRGMPLHTLAGYASAETRVGLVGTNLRTDFYIDMSGPLEYSPFGAALVERVREDPQAVHTMTGKWERALVASPGTAILGLGAAPRMSDGALRAEAADAIMEGKAKYFLRTAGVRTDPICIRTHLTPDQRSELSRLEGWARDEQERVWRAETFARTVLALGGNYGFINVEDAQGKDLPIILGILEALQGEAAVWSDDKQGTGVITAAAMLAWTELTDRKMADIRVVLFGAGAGAMGVYDELLNHGVRPENILVTDRRGVLHEDRTDINGDPFKIKMRQGIPEGTTVEGFAKGADALINLGVRETLTGDLAWTEQITRSLAPNPFFGPMTNPDPGITPAMLRNVREDAFYGSGNQVHENPVNNFTAFGYIGAGALMARAGGVGPSMTVAAAHGILEVAKMGPPRALLDKLPPEQREFGRYWLVPRPDDIRLIQHEAGAVAKAAAREGLALLLGAHPTRRDFGLFDDEIDELVRARTALVNDMRRGAESHGRRYLKKRYPKQFAPFAISEGDTPAYYVAPQIDRSQFEGLAHRMGIKEERWNDLIGADDALKPKALTTVLKRLKPAAQGDTDEAKRARRELEIILQITEICPALGLALALRRTRVRPENLAERPTVFHREAVLRTVLRVVPEARKGIYAAFEDVPEVS